MPLYPSENKELREKYEYMLSSVENEGRNLSTWEKQFIESLRDQFDRSGRMSEKQAEILERIYVEKV